MRTYLVPLSSVEREALRKVLREPLVAIQYRHPIAFREVVS